MAVSDPIQVEKIVVQGRDALPAISRLGRTAQQCGADCLKVGIAQRQRAAVWPGILMKGGYVARTPGIHPGAIPVSAIGESSVQPSIRACLAERLICLMAYSRHAALLR